MQQGANLRILILLQVVRLDLRDWKQGGWIAPTTFQAPPYGLMCAMVKHALYLLSHPPGEGYTCFNKFRNET